MTAAPQTSNLGSGHDGAIGWDELPMLDGREVARRNADLAQMGRLVFSVGGASVRFTRTPCDQAITEAPREAVWLSLHWAGMPVLGAVSPALAHAVALSLADQDLEQLGPESVGLFAQIVLAPLWPAGLVLRQAAVAYERLTGMPEGLQALGTWVGRHQNTGEPSGHAVTLWAAPDFPLAALLEACTGWASARLPSPLEGFPVELPLVAARWSVEAGQLADLAVGDVLLLN